MTDTEGSSGHRASSMSLVHDENAITVAGSDNSHRRHSEGVQKDVVVSFLVFLFHILQIYGGSDWIYEKFSPYMQRIFRITSDFLGVVIELFGLEYVNTDRLVLFIRSSISICLLLGIFSFHLGVKVTGRLILSMLVFLPMCIALGYLLDNQRDTWILFPIVGYLVVLSFIVILLIAVYYLNVNTREYILTKIVNRFMYPIHKMVEYCSCGSREAEDVLDTIPIYFLLVSGCLTCAIFAMFVGMIEVFWIISVFMTTLPLLSWAILRCKLNLNGIHDVLTKFVWDVNFLHRDLVQLFAVGQLGKYLRDSDNRSWSLVPCVVSCYVISPLLHLALTTHECRKLSHRLGDNSKDYPKTVANSGAVFAHLCGIKQNCYWWPLLEFIVKNTHTVLLASDIDYRIYISLIWILLCVYISVRPHQKCYVLIFNSCELFLIALTDTLRKALPNLSSTILKCIVLVIPSLAAIGVLTLQLRMNMTGRPGAEPDQSDNESQGGEQNNRNTIIGERVTRVIYACQLPIALLSFMACVIDWFHLFDAVSIT